MNGDLIGVNTAILSQSGTSSGVGFAIPAALVKQVVDDGAGRRPRGGAALAGPEDPGADRRDRQEPGPGRAAGRAGRRRLARRPGGRAPAWRSGDVIVSVDGAAGERPTRRSTTASPPARPATTVSLVRAQGRRRPSAPSPCASRRRRTSRPSDEQHPQRPQSAERRDGGQPLAGRRRRSSASIPSRRPRRGGDRRQRRLRRQPRPAARRLHPPGQRHADRRPSAELAGGAGQRRRTAGPW